MTPVAGASASDILPDLDQSAPYSVATQQVGTAWQLGFGSQTVNVGRGRLIVHGSRSSTSVSDMTVTQTVDVDCFCPNTSPTLAKMRYVSGGGHSHWHLLNFERYTLKKLDGTPVGQDRKTGFCLANLSPDNCAENQPGALRVEAGLGSGIGDSYGPYKEGQYVDITGLRSGDYVLMHETDPDRLLREVTHANNYASVRIRLKYSRGVPSAKVIATCPATPTC